MHGCTNRIAVGSQQGRKVFTLHAGVATKAHQREKLERLCRYITRPAVSEKRLSLTSNGKVRYELKTPWRDGTTHVFFEPWTLPLLRIPAPSGGNDPGSSPGQAFWAQRLKRVFGIDIKTCGKCGGPVKVIACIEDPVVIKKILTHRQEKTSTAEFSPLPESRAPPQVSLFD